MDDTIRRKKDPEHVRQALLSCACAIATEEGFNAVSVQKVATRAGVTKGGLFHHFPTKKLLMEAMHKEMLRQIDAEIDVLMEGDSAHGAFTRAYIKMMIKRVGEETKSAAAALSVLTETELCAAWAAWMAHRLDKHRATDAGAWLETLRFAADGIWLSTISGVLPDPKHQAERLITATYKEIDF